MKSPEEPHETLPTDGTAPSADTSDDTHDGHETVSISASESTSGFEKVRSGETRPKHDSFGDYELIEEIARGGMGVVYKARQQALNRTVALKMILSGQFANEEEIVRFRAEAAAAAGLDHPAIVPIYEVGQQQGQHFFSMGFVEGQSLAKRIAQSPLASRDAAEMLLKITDAVDYAHQRGIVHRDLKPANVLLKAEDSIVEGQQPKTASTPASRPFGFSGSGSSNLDSRPLITDFGLAKRIESDSNLTASGQILGTPSYMPPEQAKGMTKEIGVRSDVYSIGAILYCMLTGRPPFHSASLVETIRHVCELDPVPPRQINPEISRDLETICLKCLEKEPARRYQTARQLAEDLEAFLDGRPVKSRPIGTVGKLTRWADRKPVIASLSAAVILVTVIGVAGVAWQWRVAQGNLRDARSNLALAEEEKQRADEQRAHAETSFELARTTVKRFLTIVPNHELINKSGMEPVKRDLQTLGRDYYLKLAEARPDDSQVLRGLAESHFFLAMTLEDLGQTSDSAEQYSKAADIYRRLADQQPESGELQRNLAACLGNLANVQINLGMRSQGIETYRRIRDMQQAIIEQQPDDSVAEVHLAMTYLNLGLLELDDGRIDEAMESSVKASEVAEQLLGEFPDDMQIRFVLAKAFSTTGRLRRERKQNADALSDYNRAADDYGILLQANPDDPQLHAEISGVFNDTALIHAEQNDRQAAEQQWKLCLTHAQTAHDQAPQVLLFRENLGIKLRNRGLFLRNTGRLEQAAASLTASRNLNLENPNWLYTTGADMAGFLRQIDENVDSIPEQETAKRDDYRKLAIQWLTEAVDRGFSDVAILETATDLDALRGQPAFIELLTTPTESEKVHGF